MTRESMSTDTRKGDSPPGFVKCPNCNAWVDKKEAKCTACGNEMGATTTKKCPHCYSDIDARASVCPFCREKISSPISQSDVKTRQETKKSNRLFWFVLITLALCSCGWWALSNSGGSSTSSSPRATALPRNALVIYEVTGTARTVDLTIENETGNTEQFDDVRLPYKKTFSIERGEFVYLSAQNQDESGSVTCTITVDGDTLETATSSGAYVIAGCSGSAD